MIPLHLRSTTIHVTEEQAARLVARSVADWLPGVHALICTRASDQDVLAIL